MDAPKRPRGRPKEGTELVDKTVASEEAKQRLKVVLQSMAGVFTIEEACRILGMKKSMFHKLRMQFLSGAVHLLEPKTPGRKRHLPTDAERENKRLREELEQSKFELKAQQVREEIGLLMPHLLKSNKIDASKKTKRK